MSDSRAVRESAPRPAPLPERAGLWILASVYAAGLALQLWMWSRASYAWDQVELARLGVALVEGEGLAGAGKAMSGGGTIPGSLLQLLLGVPLFGWLDLRAPALLVVAGQALGGLLLARLVHQVAGVRIATLYLAVYWLGPWRVYHGGFVWEPNYLLLPAALHLVACWASRESARFRPSFALGAVLVASPQLHASAIVLWLATAWLVGRRRILLAPGGALCGALLGGLSLLPTATTWARAAFGGSGSLAELGFVKVFPLTKALGYWFRLGSLDVGRRFRQLAVYPGEDPGPPHPIVGWSVQALEILAMATVLVALVAGYRFLVRRDLDCGNPDETRFLRSYVLASLGGLLLAVGLTSQTVQGWHTLVVLHAASIAPALWLDDALRGRGARRAAAVGTLVLRLPIVALLALAHPMYRPPSEPLVLESSALAAIEDPREKGPDAAGGHSGRPLVPPR